MPGVWDPALSQENTDDTEVILAQCLDDARFLDDPVTGVVRRVIVIEY